MRDVDPMQWRVLGGSGFVERRPGVVAKHVEAVDLVEDVELGNMRWGRRRSDICSILKFIFIFNLILEQSAASRVISLHIRLANLRSHRLTTTPRTRIHPKA